MFQSSTASVLPVSNPELTEKSEPSNYNWKTLTKAGLVFATTTGAFLALKATGSFSLISSWWRSSTPNFDSDGLQEDKVIKLDDNILTEKSATLVKHFGGRKLLGLSSSSSSLSNEPPTLVNNELTVEKGQQAILTSSNLNATDVDDDDASLTFQLTELHHGQFELVNQPNEKIYSFTQQQIYDNEIRFIHDGSNISPSYKLYVSDGVSSTDQTYSDITFFALSPLRNEFLVNTFTNNHQHNSHITKLKDGKLVIVWQSQDQDTSFCGIYGQLFNSDGTKYNSEFLVNTFTYVDQENPAVTVLNDGKFVVVWESYLQDGSETGIYGQLFNNDGSEFGSEFQVNTFTDNHQQRSTVAGLSDGNFVIAWESMQESAGTDFGVYGQLFNPDSGKNGTEFQVNTFTAGNQQRPVITGLSTGEFLISWESENQDGSNKGIYGQLFNPNASKSGIEFQVNTFTDGDQSSPSVAGLNNGEFIITWESINQDSSGYGIYGQLFDSNAVKNGTEFRVNTFTISDQRYSAVAGLSDGRYVVTWESDNQDSNGLGIYGQLYHSDGSLVNEEFKIHSFTANHQQQPAVTGLDGGGFVVAWESELQDSSGYGVYGQIFRYDYAPKIVKDELTLLVGETVILTGSNFNATDSDDDDATLIFTMSNVQHGQFEEVSNPGVSVTNFTQQQINDGNVQFVHDGSDIAPTCQMSIRDKDLGLSPMFLTINCATYNEFTKSGTEFQINTYTISDQDFSSVTSFSDGQFVVTWSSFGQDGSWWGVHGQLFNGDGTKQGIEFQVNTYTISDQWTPSVASFSDDRFVVTWSSYGQDGSGWGVYGQLFNSNGTKQDMEFQVNTYTINNQWTPSIASSYNNNFVITWTDASHDGSDWGIYGQLFNSSGNKTDTEFRVNTSTIGRQNYPSVTFMSNGRFVVTWEGVGDGSGEGIYGQLFDSNGEKSGTQFQVNSYTINHQADVSVASFSDGRFVVIWNSDGQDGSGYGIYGQLFNSDATKNGSEFRVNTYIVNGQQHPFVAGLIDNKFVVTWMSYNQDGSDDGIYGQIFNADGTKFLSEFRVNTYTTSIQRVPSIASFNDGKFIVTWTSLQDGSSYGVYGQLFTPVITTEVPILKNNNLIINEGQTITLTSNNLSATDVDDDDNSLSFIVSNTQQGQFELTSNPGIEIITFTQQQVINGEVQFIHDGGEEAPGYDVTVNDGILSTSPIPAFVIFDNNVNDIPVLLNNTLTINQGQKKVITGTELSATDSDNDDTSLVFLITNSQRGQFELCSQPEFSISNFTQQQITNSEVCFIHDDSVLPSTYKVSVSDGDLSTVPTSAIVYFNARPILGSNNLTINEGQTVVLNSGNLSATDVDNDDNSLTFTPSNIQYGQFELASNPSVAITSFTQQQIINSEVQFVHDGSENTPSYDIAVSDGSLSTTPVPAIITFLPTSSSPTLSSVEVSSVRSSSIKDTSMKSSSTSFIGSSLSKVFSSATSSSNKETSHSSFPEISSLKTSSSTGLSSRGSIATSGSYSSISSTLTSGSTIPVSSMESTSYSLETSSLSNEPIHSSNSRHDEGLSSGEITGIIFGIIASVGLCVVGGFFAVKKMCKPNREQLSEYDIELDPTIPKTFICSLTGKMMNDPVEIAGERDRFYDREAIEQYFAREHKSPTGKSLKELVLIPNYDLRSKIDEYKETIVQPSAPQLEV